MSHLLLPRRNMIINGDMSIFQRTNGATSTDQSYTMDQWCIVSSNQIWSTTRSTTVPTLAQAGRKIQYSMLLTNVVPDASIGASDFGGVRFHMEGHDWQVLAQCPMTLSFWVRASKTGTYCVGFNNEGGGTPDRAYIATYTINTINTWERKVINIPASPAAGTWNYTDGIGLRVYFTLSCGSNFQNTAGAWNTVSAFTLGTSGQANLADTVSATFYLADVQLERGNIVTPFDLLPVEQRWQLCYRYLWVYSGAVQNANGILGPAWGTGTGGQFNFSIPLPQPLRVSPTSVSFSDASHFSGLIGTASAPCTGVAYTGINDTPSVLYGAMLVSGTPFTVGHGGVLYSNTADSRIFVSAEL